MLEPVFHLPKPLQEKMQEYVDKGVRLGWLIDPQNQQVEIYCGDRTVGIKTFPVTLLGEDVLLEFALTVE